MDFWELGFKMANGKLIFMVHEFMLVIKYLKIVILCWGRSTNNITPLFINNKTLASALIKL